MKLFSKFDDKEREAFKNSIEHMVKDLVTRDDFSIDYYDDENEMLVDFYFYLTHEHINPSFSIPVFLRGKVGLMEFISDEHTEEIKKHLLHAFKNVYRENTLAEELNLDITLPEGERKLLPNRYIGPRFWSDEFKPFEKDILLFIQKNQKEIIKERDAEETICDKCSPDYDAAKITVYHLPVVNKEEMIEFLTEHTYKAFTLEEARKVVENMSEDSEYVLFDYEENGVLHYRKDWVDLVEKENADLAQFSLEITYCQDCGGWEINEYQI